MPSSAAIVAVLTAFLVACGDDGSHGPDARVADASVDAIDAPPGPCGAEVFFTGEYVDWYSTTAMFRGVDGATWTVRDQPERTGTTAPNGRIMLCLRSDAPSVLDVVRPESVEPPPPRPGYLPAVFVAEPAVYSPPNTSFSVKGLKVADAPAFYSSLGLTFDQTRGHVLVHQHRAPIALALGRGGTAFAAEDINDNTWAAGGQGGLVLFANIDLAGGATTALTSGTSFVGPTSLPLEAGVLTITAIR